MSTCRQTQDIIYYIKTGNWKSVLYYIKNFNKLTFQDTFMRFPCMIFGHKYSIKDFYTDGNLALYTCNRCHKYIEEFKPQLEGLSIGDTKMIKYIEEESGEKVYYKLENTYIKLFWKQSGSNGGNNFERQKINNIKQSISDYLKFRLIEFYYSDNRQFIYIKYEADNSQ